MDEQNRNVDCFEAAFCRTLIRERVSLLSWLRQPERPLKIFFHLTLDALLSDPIYLSSSVVDVGKKSM